MSDGTAAPRTRRRRMLVLAMQLAVAIALLVTLWRVVDGPETARLLGAAEPGFVALCLAALSLHTVLAALRWRRLGRGLGIELTRGDAVAEYYVSQFVNAVVPGGVVGDASRAVRSRAAAGLGAAGLAVVLDRLAGQYALIIVMAAAVTATVAVPGGIAWPEAALPALGALVAGALALPALIAAARRLPGLMGTRAHALAAAVRVAVGARRTATSVAALSAGTSACILVAFAAAAAAVGTPLGLPATLAIVPVVLISMVLPITVGGWGVREGAAVALLPLAGLSASAALAASILFGILALAASLPGIVPLWGRRQPRAHRT